MLVDMHEAEPQPKEWSVDGGWQPTGYRECIEVLIADPELRVILSDNARKHAISTFDIKVELEIYEQVYSYSTFSS